ncbi:DnaJ domain-containing protein [Candidatus Bipolaricaulota bacterium]|nr:DnaJ domain-containing protein [Candidatus Bipolaricaulota bacterium]
MERSDYYAALQVHPKADEEVISAAYRKLAAKHHPDVNASPDATARMKQLNEAYAVLADPARRAAYDRSRGTTSEGKRQPDSSWLRVALPLGLAAFSLLTARLGIRLALMLLVFAAAVWVIVKLWK